MLLFPCLTTFVKFIPPSPHLVLGTLLYDHHLNSRCFSQLPATFSIFFYSYIHVLLFPHST